MKTSAIRIIPLLFSVLCLSLVSCGSDDDVPSSSVPSAVSESMKKMFPNATDLEWQRNQQYFVADFNYQTFDTEAWFLNDGTWAMTETDYDSMVTMLPMEVQNAFNKSQYSAWIVDDATYYQRVADSFCVIEVETDGFPEIALFYDSFGNLINKVQGQDFNITPTTVIESIAYGA